MGAVWIHGEEVIEKSAALRRTPISESQSARIKISLDECMHERVDGFMDRWVRVRSALGEKISSIEFARFHTGV